MPKKVHDDCLVAQDLCENDPDRRLEICEWAIRKLKKNANISFKIIFTVEVDFYVHREVNQQNIQYGSNDNHHRISPTNMEDVGTLKV